MTSQPVPRLDLAPKLRRPLSLWNPLDYVRLLYWVFFFPQAIRWYVERFGDPAYTGTTGRKEVWESLQRDPIQRRLVMQGMSTLIAGNVVWLLFVQSMRLPLDVQDAALGVAFGVAGGVVLGVALGVVFGVAGGVAGGVALSVAGGVALGVAGGVALSVAGGVALGVAGGVAGGIAGGVALGVALGVTLGVAGGVALGVVRAVALAMAFGVTVGVAGGVALAMGRGVAFPVALAVAYSVTLGVASARPLNWCLAWPVCRAAGFRRVGNHASWLPLPGLRNALSTWLQTDWEVGVSNLNEMLSFSLQFIPVVRAATDALAVTPPELVVQRVASLTDRPYDWNLLRFCSADLNNHLVERGVDALFIIPKSWRRRIQARCPSPLRTDTPARAACAGFWLWHKRSLDEARDTFAQVDGVRYGSELHNIAQTFVQSRQVQNLVDMAALEDRLSWLNALPDPELRPGTLAALSRLGTVAGEARIAHLAAAPLNRSAAMGRANAALTDLIETAETICPYPEWPIVQGIATQWRDILIKAGGVLGEEVLRQPTVNPYEGYSGLPVTGAAFVGRRDLLREIETRWVGTGRAPPLILYGHRRMGKTSILRQMGGRTNQRNVLVYLNMQNSGWVENTGDLLLDVAEAIHAATRQAGLNAGPAPVRADYAQFGDARYALNHLLRQLALQLTDRRLVLAIDEFEVIQDRLDDKRIDAGLLPYLRALGQEYSWLAFMFAGLHTLDEMGHDYRSAFYGQAEHLRVGYLSRADAIDLITRPHPDFALEYEPALREELYRLTYGQPYLLQRLCWELVNRWNERFLVEGKEAPRTLTIEDLESVISPDFYNAAGYYFDGVWSNITDHERQLLGHMATRTDGEWTTEELAAVTGWPVDTLRLTIDLLRRHDVIVVEGTSYRFASEIMRRWVIDITPTLSAGSTNTGPDEG